MMIQRIRTLATRSMTGWLGVALLAAGAAAQSPVIGPEPAPKPEREIAPLGPDPLEGPRSVTAQPDQMQQELRQLFRQVEMRLREIDRLLSDASAGDTALLDDVGEAGIDKLLDRSREGATRSIQDIDRILEIAQQMGQQSQSSGGSCSKPGGEGTGQSPIDQAGQQSTQREQTPEAPGQAEQDGGEKPEGQKPKQQGGEVPRDGKSQDDPFAENREGAPPPGSERGDASRADGLDRWGDLPITVRDVFRTEGGSDLPPRYRDWIDSYYRRLSDHR